MRLSARLLRNALTTQARFWVSFLLGIFFTWYVIGRIGLVGYGVIALSASAFSLAGAVDSAIRLGLVRELAAAVATGRADRVSVSVTSAFVFCAPAALVLSGISVLMAALAYAGLFRTPIEPGGLRIALTVLFLAEGIFGSTRLFLAPYTQVLYAAQYVGLDNGLLMLRRLTYTLSGLVVFGLLLPDAPLHIQLFGFAASRVTIQLADVVLGVVLAKRMIPGVQWKRGAFAADEFRSIAGTVWQSGQVTLLMDSNVQFLAVLINLFFGMTYNGMWQVVVQLGGYARRFGQGLLRGVEPLSTHMQQQGRQAAAVDLMERTIRYQLGTLLPLVAAIAIFLEPILHLWIGGRMARDPQLAAAGVSVAAALRMITLMSLVHLAAQVVRGSMFGVQRILYGLGEVRSYSWFAKYAAAMNVAMAALLMGWFGTPVVAPVALLLTYLIFYPGVTLWAAVDRVGLDPVGSLKRSIPRPLTATILLALPLLVARQWFDRLTVPSLAGLAAGGGLLYVLLLYAVVLQPVERGRIRRMFQRGGEVPAGPKRQAWAAPVNGENTENDQI